MGWEFWLYRPEKDRNLSGCTFQAHAGKMQICLTSDGTEATSWIQTLLGFKEELQFGSRPCSFGSGPIYGAEEGGEAVVPLWSPQALDMAGAPEWISSTPFCMGFINFTRMQSCLMPWLQRGLPLMISSAWGTHAVVALPCSPLLTLWLLPPVSVLSCSVGLLCHLSFMFPHICASSGYSTVPV